MEENKPQMPKKSTSTKADKKGLITALIIILIIVVIGAAILFYVLFSKMSDLKEDTEAELPKVEKQVEEPKDKEATEEVVEEEPVVEEEQKEEEPEPEPEPKEIDYYSRKYGFGLTFPLTWKDYEVVEEETKWEGFSAPSLYFGFDDQKGLFAVSIFTKEQWDKLQDSFDARQVSYLGENSNYVYAWSHSQFLANKEMEERAAEVPDIIKSFYTDAK